MSASEKLKALDENRMHLASDETLAVLAALPQIVAVVDLAHGIAETDAPLWGTRDGLGFKLQAALTALEEALS